MASASSTFKFLSLLVALFVAAKMAIAGDPDIISSFIVPLNATTVDGAFFTFTSMRGLAGAQPPSAFITLQAGDMFIVPKGLVHFQYNADAQNPALAISAFGSASAGTVSLPTTSIDDNILAKAFKTDVATIQALNAGLAPKP
ncbi:germin-like protein 9-3 [Populus alba x Populus x berolinensis]|nr:germin-like protein 9-3 [Populus alba x Populus x berolinensis]